MWHWLNFLHWRYPRFDLDYDLNWAGIWIQDQKVGVEEKDEVVDDNYDYDPLDFVKNNFVDFDSNLWTGWMSWMHDESLNLMNNLVLDYDYERIFLWVML